MLVFRVSNFKKNTSSSNVGPCKKAPTSAPHQLWPHSTFSPSALRQRPRYLSSATMMVAHLQQAIHHYPHSRCSLDAPIRSLWLAWILRKLTGLLMDRWIGQAKPAVICIDLRDDTRQRSCFKMWNKTKSTILLPGLRGNDVLQNTWGVSQIFVTDREHRALRALGAMAGHPGTPVSPRSIPTTIWRRHCPS